MIASPESGSLEPRPSKVTVSGAAPEVGVADATAMGGLVRLGILDTTDCSAVEIHVEEVATGPNLQLNRTRGPRHKGDAGCRIGYAAAFEYRPDTVARVVREEQGAGISIRVGATGIGIKGESGDRGAAARACLAGYYLRAMVIGIERCQCRSGSLLVTIQVLTKVQIRTIIATLAPCAAFIAGPAEVVRRWRSRISDEVDLLPGAPANVTHPDLVCARSER